MIDNYLIFLVLGPILLGILQYLLKNLKLKYLVLIGQVVTLIYVIYLFFPLSSHDQITMPLSIVPLPVGMVLRVDGLSVLMLLVNNLIFALLNLSSVHKQYYNKLFIFLYLVLQGLINGIFLSTDFFNIYLLIELATIVVCILIMYKKDGRSHYDGMVYLIINMVGMAFFLMGVGYLYKIFGALDFDTIGSMVTLVDKNDLVLPLAFLLTGASLKAAFMPLFSWLPKAHGTASAPTVIAAILSGVFVKTGIYLFIRLLDIFGSIFNLSAFVFILAAITAVLGAIFAASQKDIKLLLAYSTISQVGLIMLGLTAKGNYSASLFYLVNHAIFKAGLFFLSGILLKHYQTRRLSDMKGLWQDSRLLSIGLITFILSLTGLPLLGSGMGKYMISQLYDGVAYTLFFYGLTFLSWLYCMPLLMIIPGKSNHKKASIHLNQRIVLVTFILLLLAISLGVSSLVNRVTEGRFNLSSYGLDFKLLIYLLITLTAYLIYKLRPNLNKIRDKIQSFDLEFNTINLAILAYFVVLLAILK